jgi:two-component system, LuxR family, sensor kinase FixL
MTALWHRPGRILVAAKLALQPLVRIDPWFETIRRHLGSTPIVPALLVCVAYYLGAKLGFALTLQPRPVSILWPPNSILLAGLLLTPSRMWKFVLLGAFPAHLAIQIQNHVPLPMMLSWFFSNSFEALLGAGAIRYLIPGQFRFDSFRNLRVFVIFGVFLAPFVSSFLDAGLVALNGWGASTFWEVWRTRFLSNVVAAMTLCTVIVSWGNTRIGSIRSATRTQVTEATLLAIGLLFVGFLIFVFLEAGPGRRPILIYAPLPFLLWAATRFGFKGISTAILALVLLAIWGTAHGRGPFSSQAPLENALSLQLFLIVVSVPLFCLAAVLDERRRTEDALRRSEARYREVVEAQTDLICRFLPDTTLTFVNEAYCRFLNRRREELLGAKFSEFLPEAARRNVLDHLASLISNPRVEAIEHQVLLPNNTQAWHQWINHAIRGPDGTIVEFQAVGHDITDRKRAEEATAKLNHMSRVAMVGELTASIVHEISQPLGAILSNAEAAEMLLEADPRNVKDLRHILSDIRKDDVRATEVIRHIRNLLFKRQGERVPVNLNEVLAETLTFISIEARRRHIICESAINLNIPLVKGDVIQLQQVVLNLILNAMDSMDATDAIRAPKRRLRLATDINRDGCVEVIVCDAGAGIPLDQVPKLFESFSTTKGQGMGLGLSISKAIIEAHGGKIWGLNNVDGGATFGFALPAMSAVEAETAIKITSASRVAIAPSAKQSLSPAPRRKSDI